MVRDILVENVTANASVEDVDFNVTFIQVERGAGHAAYAKIKGIASDPERLALNQRVTADINGGQIFSGSLKVAEQNEEGIVIIEAYNQKFGLSQKLVTVNEDTPRFATEVARDILESAGVDVAPRGADPSELDSGQAYVPAATEFPAPASPAPRKYGSGKAGAPLYMVLRDLTRKAGGTIWIDKNDVLRIEPFPPHNKFKLKYVTDLQAGENTTEKNKVIVKGGSPVSDLGLDGAHVYRQTNITSSSFLPQEGDTDVDVQEGIVVYEDKNITTQKEAETVAMTTMIERASQAEAGKVEVVGNTGFELFDTVRVAELQRDIVTSVSNPELRQTLTNNDYTVQGITHAVNSQDGFVSTLNLSPSRSEIISDISGPASGLQEAFKDSVEDSERDEIERGPDGPLSVFDETIGLGPGAP